MVDNSIPTSNLNDWKMISSLSSSYKEFEDKHKNDIEQLERTSVNGTLNQKVVDKIGNSWTITIKNGINELNKLYATTSDKKNQQIIKEVIKDLNKSLITIQRLLQPPVPNCKQPFLSNAFNIFKKETKSHKLPIPALVPNIPCIAKCDKIEVKNRYDLSNILNTSVDSEKLRCCIKNLFIDENNIDNMDDIEIPMVQSKLSKLESVDNLILYYNTRSHLLDNLLPVNFKKQITSVELIPRNESQLFIPFEYMSIFPAIQSMVGVYTSNFSYMFKYITHAKDLWIPNFLTSIYFDNNQNRILQFLDMPNLKDIHITKKLSEEDAVNITYNIYINNLPQLISFENSTNIYFDSIRMYNLPVCKLVQNKLYAKQIDIRNCNTINNLNIIVDENCIIHNLESLKTLNVKLNMSNAVMKIRGVPSLETFIIQGDVNLGNSNKNIILHHGTIHNLRTFIIEGDLVSNSQLLMDNFIYEIVKNNKNLTHININGKSMTGKDLYDQYKILFTQNILPVISIP